MAEHLKKQPKRGILKQSTSFEQKELSPPPTSRSKKSHFDEQNILETFHPENKDYGFMKIDEAKTPYEYASDHEEDEEEGGKGEEKPAAEDRLDAQTVADNLAM